MKFKKNKNNKTVLFAMGSLVTLGICSSFIGMNFYNSQHELNDVYTNINTRTHLTKINNTNNENTIPVYNDTNGKSLVLGKNILRLNNKIIFSNENNLPKLESASTLTVYDQELIKIQEIILPKKYNQLTAIDDTDIKKGVVVSGDNASKAIYYPIDLANAKLDENAQIIVDVPVNTYKLGGNINYLVEDKIINKPIIFCLQLVNQKNINEYSQIKLTIRDIQSNSILENFKLILDCNFTFDQIKLINSYAINDNLFLGINFLKNNSIIFSNLVSLKNGELVLGGPSSVFLPFSINAMTYDPNGAIYIQYYDKFDNTLRYWSYYTDKIDRFAQLDSEPITTSKNNIITNMIAIPNNGIIGLNAQKNTIKLFKYEKSNFWYAPNFTNSITYKNSFVSENNQFISDLVYNQNTKKINLFYSYNAFVDGVIFWSDLNSVQNENIYTNIVPVHINYKELIDLINSTEWKKLFASEYANKNISNSFEDFLVIPEYWKEKQNNSLLNQDESFEILFNANDIVGAFNLIVQIKNIENQHINLLNFDVIGFEAVDYNKVFTKYDYSSDLLRKTPTELNAMINNPNTVEETKEKIFDLFGINKRYQRLEYQISIKDYNVLGIVDIEIYFPTLIINDKKNTKSSADELRINSSNYLSFRNKFNFSIEVWFIPVVTIAGVIVLIIFGWLLWKFFGKKLYAKYVFLHKENVLHECENNLKNEKNEKFLKFHINTISNNHNLEARFNEEIPFVKRLNVSKR